MSTTSSQLEYSVAWAKFWKRLCLWLLGIPINFIPILFKYISTTTSETWTGFNDLFVRAIGDIDFLFLCVSVVFILCIEGYFLGENHVAGYRACQCICLVYFVVLLLAYCVLTFVDYIRPLFTYQQWFTYDLCVIVATFFLGIACIATLSMEQNIS